MMELENISQNNTPPMVLESAIKFAIAVLQSVQVEIKKEKINILFDNCGPREDEFDRKFANWLKSEFRNRIKRKTYFPTDLLGEPCWDMLLDLAAARLEQKTISASSACIASGVPPTTALRWLNELEKRGLVIRIADKNDGRRSLVEISDFGMNLLETYFKSLASG